MARKDKPRIDVAPRPSKPLLSDAFSALDGLDKLSLAPSPEPPPKPEPPPPAVLTRRYPRDQRDGGPGKGDKETDIVEAAAPLKPSTTAVTSKSGQTFKLSEPAEEPNSKGRVILRRETKHRGGKTVVVITGFKDLPQYNAVMIGDLAKALRNKLGCGGSFDRYEIVLQGDRPADVALILRHMGFRVDGVTE
ncbi:MAG: hypothetical protein ACAI35_15345 [Candidatus Methylacidiphilales bacterium]|nr:translation initiation factor [Candidatus Methylacidiphilales bacterium]